LERWKGEKRREEFRGVCERMADGGNAVKIEFMDRL
jgi:hypothetical protein